jgi:hypothetical protein
VQLQDLAKAYLTKTDEELLRLAMDSEQLTAEAQTALKPNWQGDELTPQYVCSYKTLIKTISSSRSLAKSDRSQGLLKLENS